MVIDVIDQSISNFTINEASELQGRDVLEAWRFILQSFLPFGESRYDNDRLSALCRTIVADIGNRDTRCDEASLSLVVAYLLGDSRTQGLTGDPNTVTRLWDDFLGGKDKTAIPEGSEDKSLPGLLDSSSQNGKAFQNHKETDETDTFLLRRVFGISLKGTDPSSRQKKAALGIRVPMFSRVIKYVFFMVDTFPSSFAKLEWSLLVKVTMDHQLRDRLFILLVA